MGTWLRTRYKRLKHAWHGLLTGRPGIQLDGREPDPAVVALVEAPYTSVAETERQFRALEECLNERNDRRAVFLSIYTRVTAAVGERIAAGGFEDPDWVSEYLVTFGNYYRRAFHAYECGDIESVPVPWQIAFRADEHGDCLFIQNALLGINAHINYDLAYALEEVSIDPDRPRKYADHCAVMEVLQRLVDETQDTLAERYADGLHTIDRSLGRLDEWVWILTIDEARDEAWDRAVGLNSRFRLRRRVAHWANHLTSAGAAYLILSPTTTTRLTNALNRLEQGQADEL